MSLFQKLAEKDIFGLVICSICIITALFYLIISVKQLHKDIISKYWLQISGKITSSEIENIEIRSPEGNISNGFSYNIRYEYEIDNLKYHGNRITFYKISTTNKGYVNKLLKKYREGTNVIIYYNKNDYNDSILEPGVRIITIVSVISIILFIICFTIITIKIIKKNSPNVA